MFVPGKPFQTSLMFAGKAGAYLSEGLRLAKDKNSSLLRKSVNFGRKKFYGIEPGVNFNKKVLFIIDGWAK